MPARQECKFFKGGFLFSLICLYGIVLSASCRQTYHPSTRFTPAQLREDFRVFRLSLEEGQPGLSRFTGKGELDQAFSAAEKSLDRPLDVLEFYRVLGPPIAAIRCGHTNVELPEFVKEQISTRSPSFPALIKIIDGRIFVWRDLAVRGSALAGKEVLSINQVPAADIISKMLAGTGGDGDIPTSRIRRIEGWNFIEKLTPMTGLHAPFELTVSDSAAGRSERIRLAGIDTPALRQNWADWFPQDQRPPRSGGLEFIDGGNIARVTVREFGGFVDDEQKRGLEEFFPDAFRQMAANRTKVLILDLRDNGGGDEDERRGVRPDHPVGYSMGDYLTNSDKNMTLALEKARLWCAAD